MQTIPQGFKRSMAPQTIPWFCWTRVLKSWALGPSGGAGVMETLHEPPSPKGSFYFTDHNPKHPSTCITRSEGPRTLLFEVFRPEILKIHSPGG